MYLHIFLLSTGARRNTTLFFHFTKKQKKKFHQHSLSNPLSRFLLFWLNLKHHHPSTASCNFIPRFIIDIALTMSWLHRLSTDSMANDIWFRLNLWSAWDGDQTKPMVIVGLHCLACNRSQQVKSDGRQCWIDGVKERDRINESSSKWPLVCYLLIGRSRMNSGNRYLCHRTDLYPWLWYRASKESKRKSHCWIRR